MYGDVPLACHYFCAQHSISVWPRDCYTKSIGGPFRMTACGHLVLWPLQAES